MFWLSQLLSYLLTIDSEKGKDSKVEAFGKRKREIGLVVSVKCTAMTNDIKFSEISLQGLKKRKSLFT